MVLSVDVVFVRCMAVRAFGDVAFFYGFAALDKYCVFVDLEDEDVIEFVFNVSFFFEIVFMKCFDEEGKLFVFKANAYDLEDVDVEDVDVIKVVAVVEVEESVGIVVVELFCKIIFCCGEGVFEVVVVVVL